MRTAHRGKRIKARVRSGVVGLASATEQRGDRKTRIWYASALNYVPVKIEQRKRGKLIARMLLQSFAQATASGGDRSL